MTTTDALLEAVRTADPIADIDVQQWSSSADAQRVLDSLVDSSIVVALRPSRRRRTLWIGATAVVAGAMATGVAASGMLGEPAPEPIRADLAAVDQGLPEDLRANPDVENAMAVASTAGGVLYAADVKDGGYCYELATDGDQPRGAVCVTASRLGDRAIDITAPIPSDDTAPLLVAGRINDDRVERIVARYPNGTTVDVELGLAGYWLFEVPDGARDVALTDGLEIVGVGGHGQEVATVAVPPLRDEDPDGALDRNQPISKSTISSDEDLTLVLGVEGSVNVAGATTLELQYPDGTTTPIALDADRSFRFMLPAERHSDFANAWGQLVARDAVGNIIATDSMSSVANMRREHAD
jgi:hypothetical protein